MTEITPVPAAVQKSVKKTGKTSKEQGTEFAGFLDQMSREKVNEETPDKTQGQETGVKKSGTEKDRTEELNYNEKNSPEEMGQMVGTDLMLSLGKIVSSDMTEIPEIIPETISETLPEMISELSADPTELSGQALRQVPVTAEGEPDGVQPEIFGLTGEQAAAETDPETQPKPVETETPLLDETAGEAAVHTAAKEPETKEVSEKTSTSDDRTESQISETMTVSPKEAGEDGAQKRTEADGEKTTDAQIGADEKNVLTQEISSGQVSFREQTESVRGSETVRTTAAQLPQDVGKAIASRMPNKSGELTIELEPRDLGKIIVKVTYESDRATVSLIATNPKTLELLSKDAGSIAGIIEEKTGQETVVYTPQNEEPPEHQGQEQQGSGQNEREQKRDRRKEESESFLQQFRLGLV